MPPYGKYTGILNPPKDFTAHKAAIRRQAKHSGVTVTDIRYGYGPCAELTLDVGTASERAVADFLEALRTNPNTRLIAIDRDIHLTAAERDRLGGRPPLEAWST